MKNVFLALLLSIFVSAGSAMATDSYYPAYHNNDSGPSMDELEAAQAYVSDFGFTKNSAFRVYLDSAETANHYVLAEACLAQDLKTCVRFGLTKAGEMNLNFGQIGALKAYNLAGLLKTGKEVVFVLRVFEDRPFLFDRVVGQTIVDFGTIFSRAPASYNVPGLKLSITSQFSDN